MIDLRLVTPHADGFERQVDKVIVRGVLGDLMFMKNTAPIVTPLGYGLVYIYEEGKRSVGLVHGGYASMKDNVVTIATDAFEWTYDIDVTRAQKAKKRAEARLEKAHDAGEEHTRSIEEAKMDLLRAINRIKHAEQ